MSHAPTERRLRELLRQQDKAQARLRELLRRQAETFRYPRDVTSPMPIQWSNDDGD